MSIFYWKFAEVFQRKFIAKAVDYVTELHSNYTILSKIIYKVWDQIINFQIIKETPYSLDHQTPLKMIINFTTFLLNFRSLMRFLLFLCVFIVPYIYLSHSFLKFYLICLAFKVEINLFVCVLFCRCGPLWLKKIFWFWSIWLIFSMYTFLFRMTFCDNLSAFLLWYFDYI